MKKLGLIVIFVFSIILFFFMETKSSRYDSHVLFPISQNLTYDLEIEKYPPRPSLYTLTLSSEDLYLLPNYEYEFVGDESVYITEKILRYSILKKRIFLEIETKRGEVVYFIIESKDEKPLIVTKEGGKRRLGKGVYTILTEDIFRSLNLKLKWYNLNPVPLIYRLWSFLGYLFLLIILGHVYLLVKEFRKE